MQRYEEAGKNPKDLRAFFILPTEKKNRLSSRQPVFKTNYLKTNLLKQIKKISLYQMICYLLVLVFNLWTVQR